MSFNISFLKYTYLHVRCIQRKTGITYISFNKKIIVNTSVNLRNGNPTQNVNSSIKSKILIKNRYNQYFKQVKSVQIQMEYHMIRRIRPNQTTDNNKLKEADTYFTNLNYIFNC